MTASQTIDLIKMTDVNVSKETTSRASSSNSNEFEKIFNSVSEKSSYENSKESYSYTESKTAVKETNNTTSESQRASNKTEEKVEYKKEDSNVEDKETKSEVKDDIKQVKENKDTQKTDKTESKNDKTEKADDKTVDAKDKTATKSEDDIKVSKDKQEAALQDVELERKNLESMLIQDVLQKRDLDKKVADNRKAVKNDIEADSAVTDSEDNSDVAKILKTISPAQDAVSSTPAASVILSSPSNENSNTVNLVSKDSVGELSVKATLSDTQNNNNKNATSIITAPNQEQVKDNAKNPSGNIQNDSSLSADKMQSVSLGKNDEGSDVPLVKAAEDAASENLKVSNSDLKQDAKKALEDAGLNQQKIDDLNVEVKSVETSADSNQSPAKDSGSDKHKNLMSQQNVQDQAVRLELQASSSESHGSAVTADSAITNSASNAVDNITNATLAKDSNNINPTQNNVHVQAQKTPSATDILSQIDKHLDAKSSQDTGLTKVSIVLRPENLGKLELELVSTKDGLEAKMIASNSQVKEMLDKNLDSLKETLGGQGVNVNNVTVKVAEANKSDTAFSFEQNGKDGNSQGQQSEKSSKGGFVASENLDDDDYTDVQEESMVSERTTQINGLNGKVDYKI